MKYLDLTMPINQSTPIFPGDPKPEFEQVNSCEKDGWNTHKICINTHFGTHIDAPWHMLKDGKRLSDFPITKFIGRAIIFDVRGQQQIDIALDGVRENDILILRTDHSKLAGQPDFYERYPVISWHLANRIVEKRLSIIGIDSYTLDPYPFEIHKILFKHDILILENLVDLEKIETIIFKILVLPLKLDKTDGAPCRVVAEINDS